MRFWKRQKENHGITDKTVNKVLDLVEKLLYKPPEWILAKKAEVRERMGASGVADMVAKERPDMVKDHKHQSPKKSDSAVVGEFYNVQNRNGRHYR